ncbi:MAG: hypothetical protein JJW00_02840 [Sulfurimonas sp.]|nr:hypothetical protein [Sulfurimonas sp.]
MKKRKGVVLFVTLMMILLLMGIVSVFLNKTKESKDKITTIFAMTQTNAIMYSTIGYLNKIELDEEALDFASKMTLPINFGESNLLIGIKSDNRLLNINSFVRSCIKDNIVSDKFIYYLQKHKLRDPNLFLDLLKDTIDKDTNNRSGIQSEIVLTYPTFRNSRIYNRSHLDMIIEYYYEQTNDRAIYNVPFDKLFSYYNGSIDLNFISLELMEFLFDDLNANTIAQIANKSGVYGELKNVPFDEYYRKKVKKGIMGQHFTTKTSSLDVKLTLVYMSQFKSHITFKYDMRSKKIYNYEIVDVSLE